LIAIFGIYIKTEYSESMPAAAPDTNTGDSQLWDDFRQGDQQAFAQLYKQYVTILYNHGIHLVKDADLVQDAIQELFIDLWRLRATLSPTTSVKFYLYRSLRRRIHQAIETTQHTVLVSDEFHQLTPLITPSHEVDYILEEQQQLELHRLQQLLPQLPPRQYEAIRLRFFDNFSWEEVANIMQMNEQSVRNLIQRAIKKLQEFFGLMLVTIWWFEIVS
jgi:RNA polymerase sigma factor (sigma-70 family)